MISLVAPRKRKDANRAMVSHDKGKVRIIEHRSKGRSGSFVKPTRPRASLPSSRTFSNLRRGSIKIFSIFRSAKGPYHCELYLLQANKFRLWNKPRCDNYR
jgi:hypothetical protein